MRYLIPASIFLILSPSILATQGDSTISPKGLAGVRLCQPLSAVRVRFPLSRDTLLESEGTKWPGKVVPVGGGRRILFEASWTDTSHVWVISTTSPRHRTARGYRVGMTLADLRAKGEELRFGYGEGYIVIMLVSDQVKFLPDDSTATAFLSRSPAAFDSL